MRHTASKCGVISLGIDFLILTGIIVVERLTGELELSSGRFSNGTTDPDHKRKFHPKVWAFGCPRGSEDAEGPGHNGPNQEAVVWTTPWSTLDSRKTERLVPLSRRVFRR